MAILQTRRVRAQCPINFNDPFDGQWNVIWQIETPEFRRILVEKFLAPELQVSRIIDADIRKEVEEMRASYRALQQESEKRRFVEEWTQKLQANAIATRGIHSAQRRLRVFCLSCIPDSLQMWAYYGENHKGVVLGFDTSVLADAWNMTPMQVRYVNDFPSVLNPMDLLDVHVFGSDVPDLDYGKIGDTWSLSKAGGWRHEQEWRYRYISEADDPSRLEELEFPRSALAYIAVGCRTEDANYYHLKYEATARYPHARFVRFERNFGKFALAALT